MIESTRIKSRWLKLLRCLMGLQPGRYQIILSLWPAGMDWSVQPLGAVHTERDQTD